MCARARAYVRACVHEGGGGSVYVRACVVVAEGGVGGGGRGGRE